MKGVWADVAFLAILAAVAWFIVAILAVALA